MLYKTISPVLCLFVWLCCAKGDMRHVTQVYDNAGVEGSFLLYDLKADRHTRINPELSREGLLPASTFKIVNSLIALEEGVIPDENYMLKWNGASHPFPAWESDHNLKSAFRNSVVWFYQDLARGIGMKRMKKYLTLLGYGNGATSAGIDMFWIQGNFRVTMEQQVALLARLHKGDLPFSKRTMDLVKHIMVYERGAGYVLRAKTGLTYQGNRTIGWFIGYIEKGDDVYCFANHIEKTSIDDAFWGLRIETARAILKELKVL